MSPPAKRMLREFRAPDEPGSQERAWSVVRAAYAERDPPPGARPSRRRVVLVPILAVVVGILVLSPAGARVGRIIKHALGVSHAARALSSLPSPGRVLVSGPGGTWTAAADGSIRHVGSWQQASWSPRGLYLAVASRDRLAAVDPRGGIRWAIARPQVSDPRWYSPSGYRVAYLSGDTLRVIAGDGTADRLLASHATRVAPAWRPGQPDGPYEVAYVAERRRLVVQDADSGQVLWSATVPAGPRKLMWSNDGRRLVVLTAHAVRTYSAGGGMIATLHVAADDAALSPDGRTLALVVNHDQVIVGGRQLFAGAGVQTIGWSPDGLWLLVPLPAANQWVFVRARGTPHVAAVSRITQQLSAGGSFPELEGWCCTATGPAG
jgi:dipeptidyl aminopeptidase/acylaminoacyl peptidase